MEKADIGLIGLAVMGQNLVLNMADHGYRVAVYNRTTDRVDEFVNGPAQGKNIVGTHSVEELVANPLARDDYNCYGFDNNERPLRAGKLDAIVNHMGNFFDCYNDCYNLFI